MTDDNKIVRIDFASRHNKQKEPEEKERIFPHQHVFASSNNDKLEFFEQFLQDGTVRVVLDTRKPNVTLPEHLMGERLITLAFDYRFGLDDFYFDQYCVRATLAFEEAEVWCDVPWISVVRIENEQTGEAVHFKEVNPDPS